MSQSVAKSSVLKEEKAAETPALPAADIPKTGFGRWVKNARDSFQSHMPQWAIDNSSRITQIGLMTFTSVMLGSVIRGRTISQDIWNKQEALLKETGLEGKLLADKMTELVTNKVMKRPNFHTWRLIYLPTAVLSFAIGAFVKDKQTPENREEHKQMSLPTHIATTVKEAFDPAHHARQTSGLIGLVSGIFAIISAQTQPGGVHKAERIVGATLISGFLASTFIKDPAKAKQIFSVCWWARLPVVITGTVESLFKHPVYKHPITAEMHELPYKRNDFSYPIGQWCNLAFAAFGFLMAGSDDKKKAQAATGIAALPASAEKGAKLLTDATMPTVEKPAPATVIHDPHTQARVQEQPIAHMAKKA